MALKILHKRSASNGNTPSSNELEYGELGINYNASSPGLFIKASNNSIINLASSPGDGTITVRQGGSTKGTFSVNQGNNTTINLDGQVTPGNGTITINQGGSQKGTFTVNQSGSTTVNLDGAGSTDLGNSTTSSSVTITSSSGNNTTINSATGSRAGVMTTTQVSTLSNAMPKSGGTFSGDVTWSSGNEAIFQSPSNNIIISGNDGIRSTGELNIYGSNANYNFKLDGLGATISEASATIGSGIRYLAGNAWIGFRYVSNSVMEGVYNNILWGNIAVTASDARLKENVTPINEGLSIVNQLNPVGFTWIDDGYYTEGELKAQRIRPDTRVRYGFIADEVAEVIPEALVQADPDEGKPDPYKDYDSRAIIAMLCKAVQELSAEVEALKAG